MAKLYIDIDKAVGMGYLSDWYQNSIDDTKPPIWTDEHIYELTNDFLVIPVDTPTADVVEVKHGEWIWTENGEADYEQFWVCSVCKEKSYIKTKFCSDCGAKMDVAKNATTERRDT